MKNERFTTAKGIEKREGWTEDEEQKEFLFAARMYFSIG